MLRTLVASCALLVGTDALKIACSTTRRAAIKGGLVALLPLPMQSTVFASDLQLPANLQYGGEETDAVARNAMSGGGGPALYDEVAKARLKEQLELATARWRKMATDVRKALDKSTPAYPVAESALLNNMNALKADMRAVSKTLSGGDITISYTSPGGVKNVEFDYNTGQYKLQPIPEQAEAVFTIVNSVYFDAIKRRAPASAALAGMAKADEQFERWLTMVEAAANAK